MRLYIMIYVSITPYKDAYNKGEINDGDLDLALGRLFGFR